jgi:hypothetical protein
VLDDLVQVLTEHTALEEKAVLPLAEKYVTAAEWSQVGRHGMDCSGAANAFQRASAGAPPDADHRSARLWPPRSEGLRHRDSAQDHGVGKPHS